MFQISAKRLDVAKLNAAMAEPRAGAFVSFEGWVREHNEGREVKGLEYECYEALALKEGNRIVKEAVARFGVIGIRCVHRTGELSVGELAVWVGVIAEHRTAAFGACEYIIDQVKHRVPIWKMECYADGESKWVNCAGCAAHTHVAGGAH